MLFEMLLKRLPPSQLMAFWFTLIYTCSIRGRANAKVNMTKTFPTSVFCKAYLHNLELRLIPRPTRFIPGKWDPLPELQRRAQRTMKTTAWRWEQKTRAKRVNSYQISPDVTALSNEDVGDCANMIKYAHICSLAWDFLSVSICRIGTAYFFK